MDLESENSALESTGDNDLVGSANPPIGDDVKIDSNGSCLHADSCDLNSNGTDYPLPSLDPVKVKEDADKLNHNENDTAKLRSESASLHSNRSTSGEYVDAFTVVNLVRMETENDQPVRDSPLSPPKGSLGSPGMSPPAGTKGKGLRKWRRIRRELRKDVNAHLDVTKILKRGSANLMNSVEVSAEMKQKSEGSVSSINAFVNNPVAADAFAIAGSSSICKVVGGSTFSFATDSDNSEDRCSKSSTAASFPKSRQDPSRASSHLREKNRMKHIGGKLSQRLQQGASQVDISKKPRGEVLNMDKENSFSSLESDSRSYSSVFIRSSSSAINNGHSEKSMGYDGEHSYDGPAGAQQSVEGLPTGPISESDTALSRQNRGRSKNDKLLENGDPLLDCVRMLQSAQEALEQEIQKFGKLGKDLQPLDVNSFKATGLPIHSESISPEVCAASSWPASEDAAGDVPEALEAQNTEVLEKQLEELKDMLKEKESRIAELEVMINDIKSSSEDLGRSIEAQQKKYKEIEAEMEDLFNKKLEAEIKYLAVADKNIIVERNMKLLLAEQKSLVSTQAQALRKIDHLEKKAEVLKDKAEEGLSTPMETSGAEIWKMQKRVAKFSSCFFIQLILFIFVLEFFMSQLLPKSALVMPT